MYATIVYHQQHIAQSISHLATARTLVRLLALAPTNRFVVHHLTQFRAGAPEFRFVALPASALGARTSLICLV